MKLIGAHQPSVLSTPDVNNAAASKSQLRRGLPHRCSNLQQYLQTAPSPRSSFGRKSVSCQAVKRSARPPGDPFFAIKMKVRDYELDQYGVVNNAVYLNYLQHVREEWMHYIGFNSGEFARAGNALALSECNVKYMRPLRTRDLFNSLAWVTKVSATSFHLYQELVKVEEDEQACKEEVALAATCIVVCLDHRYRPTRILPEWKQKLLLGRSPDDLTAGNGASEAKVIQKVSL
ncbi:hypothetical protein ABBQ32_011224 [Trebouxia sp. C0010 RCD-2024]